jgi:hypothetical protein
MTNHHFNLELNCPFRWHPKQFIREYIRKLSDNMNIFEL